MGTGIAYVFVAAGCEVTLVEPSSARAAAAHQTIVSRAAGAADRGKLDRATADRVPEQLRTTELVTGLESGPKPTTASFAPLTDGDDPDDDGAAAALVPAWSRPDDSQMTTGRVHDERPGWKLRMEPLMG